MSKCKETAVKKIKPRKLTASDFKKYGWIIQWQGKDNKKENNQFRIVISDEKVNGWRIAYLIVREKKVDFIEQHPRSYESFEPLKGRSVLFVDTSESGKNIQAFHLDQPVILKKGIWHNVVTLSKETHIKITENNDVALIKQDLGFYLSA